MMLGLAGTIGSGKGTVVSHLEDKGFEHVSVSAFLAEKAVARGVPATRTVRREIGNEFRAKGPTALLEAVLRDVTPSKKHVVIESLHTVAEVRYVQRHGGKVIAIDAPLPLRWERVKGAHGEHDEKDGGSYETFLAEQDRQMASPNPDENNIAAAMRAADFRLGNEGTMEELFRKLDAILGRLHV